MPLGEEFSPQKPQASQRQTEQAYGRAALRNPRLMKGLPDDRNRDQSTIRRGNAIPDVFDYINRSLRRINDELIALNGFSRGINDIGNLKMAGSNGVVEG